MYPQLIKELFSLNLHGGIKLGLSNSYSLNEALNHPIVQFKSIHIAGSNGKGSVATKIAKALECGGYKVGLYTSPHISCFRERIRINGHMISEEEVVRLLPKIFAITKERMIPATFFEVTTALAFQHFAENNIEIAVVETGLGGRLDATNILTPILSVITSISREHSEILGDSLDQIAMEKAGIIKAQIPVILGPNVRQPSIYTIAKNLSSNIIEVEDDSDFYDDRNSKIAKRALMAISDRLNISEENMEKGIQVRPPCRFELLKSPHVTFDVAHNPEGFQALFKALLTHYPKQKFSVVLGISKTKDIASCLKIALPYVNNLHLVTAPNGRGEDASKVATIAKKLGFPHLSINIHDSIREGVISALNGGITDRSPLVICGTFFIMHEARQALKIVEPSDPIDLNER